jgi:hypothetical protein
VLPPGCKKNLYAVSISTKTESARIIVAGAGQAFCAGADISGFAEDIDSRAADGTAQHYMSRIGECNRLMQNLTRPVIVQSWRMKGHHRLHRECIAARRHTAVFRNLMQ